MDSLKFHQGLPCPTLLRPTGGSPLRRPFGRFRHGSPAGHSACGLWPSFTPSATPRRAPEATRKCGGGGRRRDDVTTKSQISVT
jgi:hypothetical protein